MFVDEVKVTLQAGRGGNGCMSFRREKYVPRGGPDGGNGGKGGDIIFEVDPRMRTLVDYRFRPLQRANRGKHGRGKNQNGAEGADLLLKMPPGTIVKNAETGEVLADLAEAGQKMIAAHGGRGGRGNTSFKTSVNRAPRFSQPGDDGEEIVLQLELRILADVGIIGFPNAGKSTLISVISAAKPKVADYPFTTITPQLGMVQLESMEGFVVADIPGLIPGASTGIGLGNRFLRHISRTRLLVHLIDLSPENERDPVEEYRQINRELENFHPDLARKKQILVPSKTDLFGTEEKLERLRLLAEEEGLTFCPISSVTRRGTKELIGLMKRALDSLDSGEDDPSPS